MVAILHKCHCGVISSCWLAMLLLLAEAEWYEGNVSWCWPLPAGKAIFMRVCKSKCIVSAASEIQCNIEQWWKKNENWPAASLLFVLGYFMSFWERSPIAIGHYVVLYRCSDISCTQMGHRPKTFFSITGFCAALFFFSGTRHQNVNIQYN